MFPYLISFIDNHEPPLQNPAFGPGQLRSFTPIFNRKAIEVQNIWLSQLNENQTDVIKVDLPYYMSRATLDIIGLAGECTCAMRLVPLSTNDGSLTIYTGFGYEFDSLQSKRNELTVALSLFAPSMTMSMSRWTIRPVLMKFAPALLKPVRVIFFLWEEPP